jgi:hypothetical protein
VSGSDRRRGVDSVSLVASVHVYIPAMEIVLFWHRHVRMCTVLRQEMRKRALKLSHEIAALTIGRPLGRVIDLRIDFIWASSTAICFSEIGPWLRKSHHSAVGSAFRRARSSAEAMNFSPARSRPRLPRVAAGFRFTPKIERSHVRLAST